MFAFRLERVLSVRRLEEESVRVRNAAAQERLDNARRRLEALNQSVAAALEAFDERKRRDEVTAEALHLYTLHLAGLRRETETARRTVLACSAEAEGVAAELLEAYKARRSLERFREREEIVWRKTQADLEARQMDELAVSRHRAREEGNHGP